MPDVADAQSARLLILSSLPGYVGKKIEEICSSYTSPNFNHCAHFVSHALKLRLPHAALCTNVGDSVDYEKRNEGFCIRVNQVYNSCLNRRMWAGGDDSDKCFVVATLADNITSKSPLTIGDHPKKHIGILIGQQIYNDSNLNKIVMTRSLDEFGSLYGKDTALLRSDLPA